MPSFYHIGNMKQKPLMTCQRDFECDIESVRKLVPVLDHTRDKHKQAHHCLNALRVQLATDERCAYNSTAAGGSQLQRTGQESKVIKTYTEKSPLDWCWHKKNSWPERMDKIWPLRVLSSILWRANKGRILTILFCTYGRELMFKIMLSVVPVCIWQVKTAAYGINSACEYIVVLHSHGSMYNG